MSTEMVCAAAVSDPGNGAAAADVIAKSAPRSARQAQAREMVIDISLPGRHHGGNAVGRDPVPAPQASQLARTLTAQVNPFGAMPLRSCPLERKIWEDLYQAFAKAFCCVAARRFWICTP